MLVADAFTGNSSSQGGLMLRREKWAQVMNVLLPALQPGGWSAHGQPQDQLHGFYKNLNDASLHSMLGFDRNLFLRLPFFKPLGRL